MTNMYEPTSCKKVAVGLLELDCSVEYPPELDPGLAELDRGGEHSPELDPGLAHHHTKIYCTANKFN